MTEDVLMENLQESGLTTDGAALALHYLWRERRADVVSHTTSTGQKVILLKICAPNETHCCISEQECMMYDLTASVKLQSKRVNELDAEINAEDAKVREKMKSNQKQLAKVHLKRKHVLEKQLCK